MNYLINASDYKNLVEKIYTLIKHEVSNPQDIEAQYPKLVIMYEFFRLLRGEAFVDIREPLGEGQSEIQRMEDEIFTMLEDIKSKIPQGSDKAKFHYDNMISLGLRL